MAAPPNVASINQRADADTSAVDITLIGEVDVHSFREEKNYVIDVAFQQAEKPAWPIARGPRRRLRPRPGRSAGQADGDGRGPSMQADQGAGRRSSSRTADPAGDVGDIAEQEAQVAPRPKRPRRRLSKPRRRRSMPRLRPRTRRPQPEKAAPAADDGRALHRAKIPAPQADPGSRGAHRKKSTPAASEHPPESRAATRLPRSMRGATATGCA